MLNLTSKITITQQANKDFPGRAKSFTFDFVHSAEIAVTWQNLTDTAKLVFPKNIYFKDETGRNYTWQGKNTIESNNTPPLLLRGDAIKIELGYYYNIDSNYTSKTESHTVFEGFVSKVVNRIPIEIEAEDNMWKLKQVSAPNKVFPGSTYNLQSMITELLSGTGFTITSDIKTNVGDFRTQNETVAQVLDRLQRDYRIESYFRGNELRCSGIVYYSDYEEKVFQFQDNILPDDQLEYRRTDDVQIGIKAFSINEVEVMRSGKSKKKAQRLSVFVTNKGEVNEAGFEGEKRTLYFWNITDKNQLVTMAQSRLNRLYYEGFFGSFTTKGFPFVRHGDHAIIRDTVLPERNGTYKIKAVTYRFGMDGYNQDVEVDIKVDGFSQQELAAGL